MFFKISKIIAKIIANVAVGGILIIGTWAVLSHPPVARFFGWKEGGLRLLTVMSGSMEPAIKMGSLIFVRPSQSYQVGQVVTRKTDNPDRTITHRIVGQTEVGGQVFFQTKGDANSQPDWEKISPDLILGKVVFGLPYAGYVAVYARSRVGFMVLILVPAAVIVYGEIKKIRKEILLRPKKR